MTRGSKIALRAALVAALFFVLFYVLANILLYRASRKALATVSRAAEKQGVEVVYPRFGKARIVGPRTARW
ncbi:MAG: hypothetical protein AAF961_18355, partial [Planctomycetota bacterium]